MTDSSPEVEGKEPQTTKLGRRSFLKLAGVLAAGVSLPLPPRQADFTEIGPVGFEINDRIYQLPKGKVPLLHYRVNAGDSIYRLASFFNTRASLIREANKLSPESGIHPQEILKIPAYANVPMSYIPERSIIRHQLSQGESEREIAARYGIPEAKVSEAQENSQNIFRTKSERILIIRGAEPPNLVPIEVKYRGEYLLPKDVMTSLVNRVLQIYVHKADGDKNILRYLRKTGVVIEYAETGFSPPNNISLWALDTQGEGVYLQQLGHEFWHALPFPWWSAGADEGTAGYAACEWVTKNHREYPKDSSVEEWYDPKYYGKVNSVSLREMIFSDSPIENRILATEAWKKIEAKYPGTIAYLLSKAIEETKQEDKEPEGPWSLDKIKEWIVERSGPKAWDFVNSQHILFTR